MTGTWCIKAACSQKGLRAAIIKYSSTKESLQQLSLEVKGYNQDSVHPGDLDKGSVQQLIVAL